MKYLILITAISCYTYLIDADGRVLCGGSSPRNVTFDDCPGAVASVEGPAPYVLSVDATLRTTDGTPLFRWDGAKVAPRSMAAIVADEAPGKVTRQSDAWKKALDEVVRLRRLRAEDVDAVTVEEIQEAITRAQAAKARIQP